MKNWSKFLLDLLDISSYNPPSASSVAVAVYMAYLVRLLNKEGKEKEVTQIDGKTVLAASKEMKFLARFAVSISLFFDAIVVYLFLTDPTGKLWEELVLGFAAIGAIVMVRWFLKTFLYTKVFYDEISIQYNCFGIIKKELLWSEVLKYKYSALNGGITVFSRNGETLFVSEYLQGVEYFRRKLESAIKENSKT